MKVGIPVDFWAPLVQVCRFGGGGLALFLDGVEISASLDATHGEFNRSVRAALVLDRSTVSISRSASPRLRLGVASRVRGLPVHHAPERSSYSALRLQIAVARPLSRHAAHPPSVAAIRYILPAPRTRSVVVTFRGCRLAAKFAFLCGSRAGALPIKIAPWCVPFR